MEGLCEPQSMVPGAAETLPFETLPVIAMIEQAGAIVARNKLARRLTGFSTGGKQPLGQALLGAYEFSGGDAARRCRFDCLVVRRQGVPLQVSVATEATLWQGQPAYLLLMMERTEGFAGQSDTGGSFLEDVLDATPEATVITHEGRVLHVNREFSRLFGYSLAESLGEELDELVIPDGRMHENEMVVHALRTAGRSSFETVRRTRAGEDVEVSVLVSRVRLGGEASGQFVTYRDIRRQKQEEARLQHTALHDALTGLANRALFLDRLGLTMARLRRRPDRRFAVVFLDLDGFKKVNDTMGHAAGDALLLMVAERLTRCVRPQDTVARFGGDEFALLLDESGAVDDVCRVAERIQSEIRRPCLLETGGLAGGAPAYVSASMGIAIGTTRYGSAEAILRDADQAMYEAKAEGKARHVVIGGDAEAEPQERMPGC